MHCPFWLRPREHLHHEIRAKRGRKFGSPIHSPDREGRVSRIDAPHPPAATLPVLVAAGPREGAVHYSPFDGPQPSPCARLTASARTQESLDHEIF